MAAQVDVAEVGEGVGVLLESLRVCRPGAVHQLPVDVDPHLAFDGVLHERPMCPTTSDHVEIELFREFILSRRPIPGRKAHLTDMERQVDGECAGVSAHQEDRRMRIGRQSRRTAGPALDRHLIADRGEDPGRKFDRRPGQLNRRSESLGQPDLALAVRVVAGIEVTVAQPAIAILIAQSHAPGAAFDRLKTTERADIAEEATGDAQPARILLPANRLHDRGSIQTSRHLVQVRRAQPRDLQLHLGQARLQPAQFGFEPADGVEPIGPGGPMVAQRLLMGHDLLGKALARRVMLEFDGPVAVAQLHRELHAVQHELQRH